MLLQRGNNDITTNLYLHGRLYDFVVFIGCIIFIEGFS